VRWLVVLFTAAACSSGNVCTDALQVCVVQDMNGHCRYATPACCGTAWTCSTGTLSSAPGPCNEDETIAESCR
jgi:hypothetical protein